MSNTTKFQIIIVHLWQFQQKTIQMTTVKIDDQTPGGIHLLKYIQLNPHIAQIIAKNDDNSSLPVSEEKLISHQEFKAYFEKRLFERLGLSIQL